MELVTARLRIDMLGMDDAEALFAYRSHPSVARFQGWCPNDLGEAREFIEAQAGRGKDRPDGWLQRAIRLREDGSLVGDLGLYLPDDACASVEFGISLAPSQQRRGYAREAALALFEHVFGTLARHRVQASVDPRNLASTNLLRALGMRQEAHHRQSLWLRGEWVDDLIFAMLGDEWPAHQTAQANAVKL